VDGLILDHVEHPDSEVVMVGELFPKKPEPICGSRMKPERAGQQASKEGLQNLGTIWRLRKDRVLDGWFNPVELHVSLTGVRQSKRDPQNTAISCEARISEERATRHGAP
jgi:hypothetical protein